MDLIQYDVGKKIFVLSSYTRRPVIMEAMKVPMIAKVTIAPKFEKNGFGAKLKPDWV
jgi:hypothetical protein